MHVGAAGPLLLILSLVPTPIILINSVLVTLTEKPWVWPFSCLSALVHYLYLGSVMALDLFKFCSVISMLDAEVFLKDFIKLPIVQL